MGILSIYLCAVGFSLVVSLTALSFPFLSIRRADSLPQFHLLQTCNILLKCTANCAMVTLIGLNMTYRIEGGEYYQLRLLPTGTETLRGGHLACHWPLASHNFVLWSFLRGISSRKRRAGVNTYLPLQLFSTLRTLNGIHVGEASFHFRWWQKLPLGRWWSKGGFVTIILTMLVKFAIRILSLIGYGKSLAIHSSKLI